MCDFCRRLRSNILRLFLLPLRLSKGSWEGRVFLHRSFRLLAICHLACMIFACARELDSVLTFELTLSEDVAATYLFLCSLSRRDGIRVLPALFLQASILRSYLEARCIASQFFSFFRSNYLSRSASFLILPLAPHLVDCLRPQNHGNIS